MTVQAATKEFLPFSKILTGIAVPAYQHHQTNYAFSNIPVLPNHIEGKTLGTSLGQTSAFNRGEHSANPANDRSATTDCADFLKNFFRETAAKVIAKQAGINQRAAESIKLGRNGLTMAHLENLCKSNPEFRAAWFAERCGGILEGQPEMVAKLSHVINEVVRGMNRGGN